MNLNSYKDKEVNQMAKIFDEKIIKDFQDKLNALIAHEEQGIEFEKSINPESTPVVRTISVAVYRNVLKMFEEHFTNIPQKRNYTKKPGRKPKSEVQQEAAATAES